MTVALVTTTSPGQGSWPGPTSTTATRSFEITGWWPERNPRLRESALGSRLTWVALAQMTTEQIVEVYYNDLIPLAEAQPFPENQLPAWW
jgi:hypothetical protein